MDESNNSEKVNAATAKSAEIENVAASGADIQLQQTRFATTKPGSSAPTVTTSLVSSTVSADNEYFDIIRDYIVGQLDPQRDQAKAKTISMRNRSIKFPVRLMYALDHSDPEIFTWSDDGKSFIIQDTTRLEKEILPKNFKDAKFNSFLRKLYRWGFVKRSQNQKVLKYHHQQFQRQNYSLCMEMTCTDSTKARSIRIQEEIASFQAKKDIKQNVSENINRDSSASSAHVQQQQMELINQLKAQNNMLLSQLVTSSSLNQDLMGQGLQLSINNLAMGSNRQGMAPSPYQGFTPSDAINQGLTSSSISQVMSSSVDQGLSSLINQSIVPPNSHLFTNPNNNHAMASTDMRPTINAPTMNGLVSSRFDSSWNQNPDAALAPNSLNTMPTNNTAANSSHLLQNMHSDGYYDRIQNMMRENANRLDQDIQEEHLSKRARTGDQTQFFTENGNVNNGGAMWR